MLEQFLALHPEAADATLINILAELYIADEDWQAASRLIAESSDHLSAEGEVPIDLQVQADTGHSLQLQKPFLHLTQSWRVSADFLECNLVWFRFRCYYAWCVVQQGR